MTSVYVLVYCHAHNGMQRKRKGNCPMPTRHRFGMWVLRSRSFKTRIHALPWEKPQALSTKTTHMNHPFRMGEVSGTELFGELITFMQLRVNIFDGELSIRPKHLGVFFVNRIKQFMQLPNVGALGPSKVPLCPAITLLINLDSGFIVLKDTALYRATWT
jgi:hypothetical protein